MDIDIKNNNKKLHSLYNAKETGRSHTSSIKVYSQ
jgi:hypothetical protein